MRVPRPINRHFDSSLDSVGSRDKGRPRSQSQIDNKKCPINPRRARWMGSTRIDSALPAPSNVFSPQWGIPRRRGREGQRGWSTKSAFERAGRRIKKERNKERERESRSSREVGSNREGLIPLDCVPCPATSVLRPLHPHVSSPRLRANHFSLLLQQTTTERLYVCVCVYTLSTGVCCTYKLEEKARWVKEKRERVLLLFAAIFVHSHSGRIESWIWVQVTRTYTPAIVPSTRGDHKSCCLSPVDSPVDASVLVVMFERYQEKARPPRKYSTANFPLYERTTAPLAVRIATRGLQRKVETPSLDIFHLDHP